MKIQDIKEACRVSEEHISLNKEENTAVIQVETWEELLRICAGLRKLINDFQLFDVLDDETSRRVWDELLSRFHS
jgi:hypothetical protein